MKTEEDRLAFLESVRNIFPSAYNKAADDAARCDVLVRTAISAGIEAAFISDATGASHFCLSVQFDCFDCNTQGYDRAFDTEAIVGIDDSCKARHPDCVNSELGSVYASEVVDKLNEGIGSSLVSGFTTDASVCLEGDFSSPSRTPSELPSGMPSYQPSRVPSAVPSDEPSMSPTSVGVDCGAPQERFLYSFGVSLDSFIGDRQETMTKALSVFGEAYLSESSLVCDLLDRQLVQIVDVAFIDVTNTACVRAQFTCRGCVALGFETPFDGDNTNLGTTESCDSFVDTCGSSTFASPTAEAVRLRWNSLLDSTGIVIGSLADQVGSVDCQATDFASPSVVPSIGPSSMPSIAPVDDTSITCLGGIRETFTASFTMQFTAQASTTAIARRVTNNLANLYNGNAASLRSDGGICDPFSRVMGNVVAAGLPPNVGDAANLRRISVEATMECSDCVQNCYTNVFGTNAIENLDSSCTVGCGTGVSPTAFRAQTGDELLDYYNREVNDGPNTVAASVTEQPAACLNLGFETSDAIGIPLNR